MSASTEITGLIDLHSHILPGVDDGARDEKTAFAMLEAAYAAGTRSILLTPHFYPGSRHNASGQRVAAGCAALRKEAAVRWPELDIRCARELFYDSTLLDELSAGHAMPPTDSRYVLVEFSPSTQYREIMEALSRLRRCGYHPILAHVERYDAVGLKPDKIRELRRLGVEIQMNADSLLGGFFDAESRACVRLVEQGHIQLIATDCHDMRGRSPTSLREAWKKLLRLKSGEGLCAALRANAQQVFDSFDHGDEL